MRTLTKFILPGLLLTIASIQVSAQDSSGNAGLSEEERRARIEARRELRQEQRTEMRERWENMSEEQRQAAIERRRERVQIRGPRSGGNRPNGQRVPRSNPDTE